MSKKRAAEYIKYENRTVCYISETFMAELIIKLDIIIQLISKNETIFIIIFRQK